MRTRRMKKLLPPEPYLWCDSCCQWVPVGPNEVHTCYDRIRELVEEAIPARFWRKRKILYQEIYRIALRKDVYRDFAHRGFPCTEEGVS